MKIPKTNPRPTSLMTREKLVKAWKAGVAVPEGLIAHGRGEAWDYLLGEETSAPALVAEKAAAAYLVSAKRPRATTRREDPKARLKPSPRPPRRHLPRRRGPRPPRGRRPNGGARPDGEDGGRHRPEPAVADLADGNGSGRGRTHPRRPKHRQVCARTTGKSGGDRTNHPDVQ